MICKVFAQLEYIIKIKYDALTGGAHNDYWHKVFYYSDKQLSSEALFGGQCKAG